MTSPFTGEKSDFYFEISFLLNIFYIFFFYFFFIILRILWENIYVQKNRDVTFKSEKNPISILTFWFNFPICRRDFFFGDNSLPLFWGLALAILTKREALSCLPMISP